MTVESIQLELSPEEARALEHLAVEKGMSKTAVLRQALRLYQSIDGHIRNGERLILSGDAQRARDFAGPLSAGFPEADRNP